MPLSNCRGPATLSDAVHEQLSRGIDVIAADSSSLEQHQDAGPLLQRAQLLVDDADLMADAASGQSLDEAVKAKAQRVLAAGRQNVTKPASPRRWHERTGGAPLLA